jgi:hypothetical protein
MLDKALSRFSSAADLLRPRTFFRTLARVDQLVDATRELTAAVEGLRIRTEQLAEIERLNAEQEEEQRELDAALDPQRIAAHVSAAVGAAPLHLDPCPHIVVDEWLPRDVYEILIRALPPSVFFADREVSRQRLMVPFAFGPAYARRVWRFVSDEIVARAVNAALSEKFREPIRAYLDTFCPSWSQEPDQRLHTSDGRIMLRRPGYVIEPHRDPKWGFITGLVYLAREGDNEAYGTQLYRVRDDGDAPNDKPFRIEPDRCELVRSVPFRPNTLLAFLNSTGAHGASIPADATPATLERYVYQFRLGPPPGAIKRLLSLMPPEQRTLWSGAKARHAGEYA